MLARLGADEFAVLAASAGTSKIARSELMATAERVQSALAAPFIVDDVALAVEATAGLADYPKDGETSQLLLQRVDIALNLAKRNHEPVAGYDRTIDSHNPRQLRLLADLRLATRRDELVLHYQPLMDIESSRLRVLRRSFGGSTPPKGCWHRTSSCR